MSAPSTRWQRIRAVVLTRDRLLALLAVVIASAVCVGLGFWQYGRFEGKQERRDLVEANYAAEPVELARILPEQDSALDPGDQWRTVSLRGHYCTDPGCAIYVRNRPLGGQIGFWQLVPFESDQGTLLVVRGWVPMQESASEPQDPPPVPTGQETITVRMRAAEPVLRGRTDPPGQTQSVAPGALAARLPGVGPIRQGAFGELAAEDPSASPAPRALEKPDTDLGPHLSYAVQWWVFALFFPIAWVARARRAVLDELAEEPDAPGAVASPPDPSGEDPVPEPRRERSRQSVATPAHRPRRRTLDEEEEDAILEHRSR